jgi:amino acid transporter
MSQRAGDRLTLGARNRSGSHDRFLPLLALLIACSLAAVACLLLLLHATDSETAPLRLSTALIVLLSALIQICIARWVWRRRRQPRPGPEALSPRTILRLSFVGLVLCYAAALCSGPLPHSPYVFIA